jgi:hypothetical protein
VHHVIHTRITLWITSRRKLSTFHQQWWQRAYATRPTLFERVELNVREEGRDIFRLRYNRIIDELEKVELRHKAALKEHAEALKNADKTIRELHDVMS